MSEMDNYNFESGNFPKDDYALSILTQAATGMNDQSSLAYGADHRKGRNVTSEASGTTPSSNQGHSSSTSNIEARSQNRTPDILSDYNSSSLASRNMETLAFNPSLAQRRNAYMNSGYQGIGSQISQNYANSLGILNAESYDDGRGSMRERDAQEMRARMRNDKTMPFGLDQPAQRIGFEALGTGSEEEVGGKGRRKKRKDDSADEEEEARKKARGRPRVDTKDETAADRRRTQIRMAQRAYRHRKETTISSLEKQVQDMRGTNEEMSNIFINLYDFAIAKGLLQREPEFGQQLQSATERFLALAKVTQDENHEDSHEDGAKHDEGGSSRPAKVRRTSPKKRQEATPPVSESTTTWGGYTLTKDDSPVEELDMGFQQNHGYRRSDDLQIVTRPTEDNASFPFDLMDLQTYRVEVPEIEGLPQNFFPQSQPPLPNSYNYNELSFARRIHRAATETAFKLITSNNPKMIARRQQVFGLCLLYESEEAIESRLRRLMAKSTKETLQEWRAPFPHIGGAGTYYPMDNSDASGELMPKFRTGYSMGPFSPSTSRVEELMEDDMKCNLPGFEGEFFDPNDVEGYLRGHGLDIAPAAEFVTGDINLAELGEVLSPRSSTSDSVASTVSPKTPRSSAGNIPLDPGTDVMASDFDFSRSKVELSKTQNCLTFPLGNFSDWDNDTSTNENDDFIDPIFNTMPGQKAGTVTPELQRGNGRQGGTQRVTINVKVLLEELLSRGVCLGRAPGFRPSDVNAAIIIAAARAGY